MHLGLLSDDVRILSGRPGPRAPDRRGFGRALQRKVSPAAASSRRELAAALVVSAATVKTHINHIFQKTGARDRAQVVRYAYQHGLA
jgi:hypothetical protein